MITIIKNKFLHFSIGILLIVFAYMLFQIALDGAGSNGVYAFDIPFYIYQVASILTSFTIGRSIPAPKNRIESWLIRIFTFTLTYFILYMILLHYIFSFIPFD